MDIGRVRYLKASDLPKESFKPFARPKLKRRRVTLTKPPVFAVCPNPLHYVLDLSEHAKSTERTVCGLVLSDIRAVSVVGLPGAGKTVILRSIAYHPAVYGKFRDGVCLVQLGPEATIPILFDHLYEVMVKLRGATHKERVEEIVKKTANHEKAMDMILRFLKDHCFLLILDNVSEDTPAVNQLLAVLVTTRPSRARSRLTILTSTRSVDIARRFGGNSVVHVSLCHSYDDKARDILCAHAGFDRTYFDATSARPDNPVLPVLRKCSGLPLALAVAGGALKRLLKGAKSDEEKRVIWDQYSSYLCNSFDQFGEISGLFRSLGSCVQNVERGRDWKARISVEDVLSSLSIVPSGVWMPYQVLQRLWGIRKRDDVISVVRPLARVCLVKREVRRGAVGICIPDIVVDFCKHRAKKTGSGKTWHMKFLRTYVDHKITNKDSATRNQAEGDSFETTFEEDQYLQDNLGYHVMHAISSTQDDERTNSSTLAAIASRSIQSNLASKYDRRQQT